MFIHKVFLLIGLFLLVACAGSTKTPELINEVEYATKEESDKQALDYALGMLFVEIAAGQSHILKINRENCPNCYFPEIAELALILIGKLKTEESKSTIVYLTSVQLDGAGSEYRSELLAENDNELWYRYLQSSPVSLNQWCIDNFNNNKLQIKNYMPEITAKDICWDIKKLEHDLNHYKINSKTLIKPN